MEEPQIIIKKVKKAGHGAHHGGSWKVAYADFVTALMAFFLLMWLISMTSEDQKLQLSNYFTSFSIFKAFSGTSVTDFKRPSSPVQLKNLAKEADVDKPPPMELHYDEPPLLANKKEMEDQLIRDLIDDVAEGKGQVVIDSIDRGVRVQLIDDSGNPMFVPGGIELTPLGQKMLKKLTDDIKKINVKIIIEGHTDAHRSENQAYGNWELSAQRACVVRQAMENGGIHPYRFKSVTGYASMQLLDPKDPFSVKNRRVSILIVYN